MNDLIDQYQKSGLISDPMKSFRPCDCCGEPTHPDDIHTVDVDRFGEHDTIEVCDFCKYGIDFTNAI
tara:strand:+ start:799 stop:999 length:201 start_codon:yes stop_codon:yes gene_type:complete